jgi:hypothetical protein
MEPVKGGLFCTCLNGKMMFIRFKNESVIFSYLPHFVLFANVQQSFFNDYYVKITQIIPIRVPIPFLICSKIPLNEIRQRRDKE